MLFIFMSPRMEFSQFDDIVRGKLDINQAIVVGARKDLYHWADALYYQRINGTPLIDFGSTFAYHQQAVFDYGWNDNPTYNFLFLKEDITVDAQGNPIVHILGHGAMFEGQIQQHEYEMIINGTRTVKTTIRDAYKQLVTGVFDEN